MKRLFLKLSFCLFTLFISTTLFAEIPAGYYYFAKDKKGAELKTSLRETSTPLYVLNYGGGEVGYTWEGFSKTDKREDGSVWDMYSDIVRYFDGIKGVDEMHIEHSLPKSWWGGHVNYAYKDLFHLYPADGKTNSTKNDLPLGEVTGTPNFDNGVSKIGKNGFGNGYTGNCFEPADEYKGDFARSYLYISTIYENFDHLWNSPMMDKNTYPVWKPWALELLIKWHKEDPVSEKELERNEIVFGIQGNRNPFIDYPDLADYIWGENKNTSFPFPVETEPFLIQPRIGTSIDFGVILQNDTKTENFIIKGANITSNVSLNLKGDTLFSLSKKTLSPQETVTGSTISIVFTPKYSGNARDTLIISGGGLNDLVIPLKALASADFIVLEPIDITPIGCTVQWISDANATDYLINIYQGDKQAGDLIISSYVEGSSYNKSIEIYNGTGKTVDLSNYSLRKQSNGIGNFGSNFRFSGTLNNNETYVLTHKLCENTNLIAKSQVFTDDIMNFNGNDAVALYRNGVMIDIVGYADDGGEVYWGDEKTLKRKSTVTHPITKYNESDWDVFPQDTFDKLGTHTMNLASESNYVFQNKSVGRNNSFLVEELLPEKTYTYSVEAVIPEGNKKTVNTTQIHTAGLETPLALDASEINSHSFVANWEDTPYAEKYLLNVFKLEGNGSTTDTIDFNDIGSNGKPLPEGWIGTASGNYTTTNSSGKSPNSIGFTKTGEYIQTKEYSAPISKLSFMYRFPSSGAGNILAIDGLYEDTWKNIDSLYYKNTSKTFPEYNFTSDENLKAFKFTFLKNTGNLAIDDIEITYGDFDTIYVKQNEIISTNNVFIDNLSENETYYYNLRASLSESVSPISETIQVYTQLNTSGLKSPNNSLPIVFTNSNEIIIKGVSENNEIKVYSITGMCIYQTKALGSEVRLPINQKGIYLIKMQGKNNPATIKIIK